MKKSTVKSLILFIVAGLFASCQSAEKMWKLKLPENNLSINVEANDNSEYSGLVYKVDRMKNGQPIAVIETMHHHNYWSANNPEWHDNKFDFSPEETIRFINELKEPVIGFKVMAAGAIHPKDGFRYAFENGTDFVCAGMYDFQMVEEVNIACNILTGDLKPQRVWRG